MKILVTGGAGFVGHHVVQHLLKHGHTPLVVDNLSTGLAANLHQGVPFVKADVRWPMADLLAQFAPEVIVHLAAQVSVPKSLADPVLDLAVNVEGTANVLSSAVKAGVRKLIFLSSAAIYGMPQSLPLFEQMETGPLSPYGLSKRTAEQYIQMLSAMYGLEYTILRPANIYGPRQAVEGDGAVVPSFLTCFLSGVDPMIHGTGKQTRDFVHVSDVSTAVEHALTRGAGATLNMSSGRATSILELWQLLAALIGWRRPPLFVSERPGDIAHSVMANTRAEKEIGWSPVIELEDGLARTIEWYRQLNVAATSDS